MKQHITKEQLNELNDDQILKLINFVYNRDHQSIEERGSAGLEIEGKAYYTGDIAEFRCGIGKMIEIIEQKHNLCIVGPTGKFWSVGVYLKEKYASVDYDKYQFGKVSYNLCDALWEAVKCVLERVE